MTMLPPPCFLRFRLATLGHLDLSIYATGNTEREVPPQLLTGIMLQAGDRLAALHTLQLEGSDAFVGHLGDAVRGCA